MTGLRLALIVVGLLVVLAVALFSYDKFRFRPIIKRRARRGDGHWNEPVLMSQSALEINPHPPGVEGKPLTLQDDESDIVLDPDAELDEDFREMERVATMTLDLETLSPPIQEQVPDETVDYVARLPGASRIDRDAVLGLYRQHEYLLEKRRGIYGMSVKHAVWRNLESDPGTAEYTDIQLAVQLADHIGPISQSELNKFSELALKLADTLDRPLKFSCSFDEALAKAGQVDEFCNNYDALAIINILAKNDAVFKGPELNEAALGLGMHLGKMNIYHRRNPHKLGAESLYSLANLYKPGEFDRAKLESLETRGLTLFLNIPCTYDPPKAFDEMVESGKQLSRKLGGELMDPDRHPLDDAALSRIRSEIKTIAADMEQEGIEPGGETALRLF